MSYLCFQNTLLEQLFFTLTLGHIVFGFCAVAIISLQRKQEFSSFCAILLIFYLLNINYFSIIFGLVIFLMLSPIDASPNKPTKKVGELLNWLMIEYELCSQQKIIQPKSAELNLYLTPKICLNICPSHKLLVA